MLNHRNRITSSRTYAEVIRRGRRAGTPSLAVHLLAGPHVDPDVDPGTDPGTDPVVSAGAEPGSDVQAGFVVSKVVGNAVARSQVKRRLRHLVRERLESIPPGTRLVIRALPAAAEAPWSQLSSDLDSALGRLLDARREEVSA